MEQKTVMKMSNEIEFLKVQKEFKKLFNKFCLDYYLDTYQAIRILSKTIEETAHQARNIELFSNKS